MRHYIFFLLLCVSLFSGAKPVKNGNTIKTLRIGNSKILCSGYIPNPNNGCYDWYSSNRKKKVYYQQFDIHYLSSVYSRPSWNDIVISGRINMHSLDALFETAYASKVRVDIGIFYNLAMKPERGILLTDKKINGKNVYIGYPKAIHSLLMASHQYRPRLVYVPDTNVYWYCIDWRNEVARRKYKLLLEAFNNYLNENWKGATRRKYVNSIQIRFWGFWGEGHNNYLLAQNKGKDDVFEDSNSMIEIDNYYITLFNDIRLIAPGMGKTSNIPDKWIKWALYELTASNSVGEMGLFIDHIGNNNHGDFTLNYNGIKTINLALKKWKKAPITGEGKIVGDIMPIENFDIFKYHISSFLPMNATYTKEEINRMKSLTDVSGFRLYFINKNVYISGNKLFVNLGFGNMGLSPVYNNYWKVQFVIRSSTGKKLEVIQTDVNLKKILPGKNVLTPNMTECTYIKRTFNISFKGNVYLRIIDKDGISSNMYLSNSERTENGEYKLN